MDTLCSGTHRLHNTGALLLAREKASKESIVCGLRLKTRGQVGKGRVAVLGIDRLGVLGLVDALVDHSHGLVSVQEIGMTSVDIA